MGRRGVIYGRQSRTPGGGDGERSGGSGSESMDVQLVACRKIAKQYKVDVPKENEILEPPSTSAYKSRGHERPRFPELLGKLRSGEVDTLIAYKTDRLSRGGGPGWAPLLDAAEEAHLDLDRLVLVPGTGFMSEFEIGIRATMDREESKKTSERLRDMKVKHAAEGRPSGGGRTPFGYERDGRTIVPAEAEMIRDAARRLLAGEGVSSICRDWNQRGLVTNAGNPWRAGTLRNVLLNARLAGLRVHCGEIVGRVVAGDHRSDHVGAPSDRVARPGTRPDPNRPREPPLRRGSLWTARLRGEARRILRRWSTGLPVPEGAGQAGLWRSGDRC